MGRALNERGMARPDTEVVGSWRQHADWQHWASMRTTISSSTGRRDRSHGASTNAPTYVTTSDLNGALPV
jgi:hypothetical protein